MSADERPEHHQRRSSGRSRSGRRPSRPPFWWSRSCRSRSPGRCRTRGTSCRRRTSRTRWRCARWVLTARSGLRWARGAQVTPAVAGGVRRPMGVTRKQLLAGVRRWRSRGAGAGRRGAAAATPRRASTARRSLWTRATATSTPSCSPPHPRRCATRSSATAAGSTPARRRTCTSTRRSSRRRSPTPRRLPRRAPGELAFTDSTTMGLGLSTAG